MSVTQFDAFLDNLIQGSLDWLTNQFSPFFHGFRLVIDSPLAGIEQVLLYPPYYVIAAIAGLISWRTAGRTTAVFTVLSLLLCHAMNLWQDAVSTSALVTLSTAIALALAIPGGIAASSIRLANQATRPLMDFLQTMPPYVYLIPAVALLGIDRAPAVVATVIVAIPPAFRMTAVGVSKVPIERIELGKATGATPAQILWKIKIPSALPMITAGINQSLMVALGMVVIAGIIGAGGLGAVVWKAINYLQVDRAIDGGLAIVILAINIDRISQGCVDLLTRRSY